MELFDRYAFNAFAIFNFEEKYSSDSSRKFLITHSNHLLLYDVLSLAFITFLFKFAVTESAQKLVNFLCRCAASTYPLCLCIHLPLIAFVFVSADIIFSSMWNTEIASHKAHEGKTFSFPGFITEFEFITPRITDFHTIFFHLWRSWIWIVHFWFFFHVTDFTW